ncbi:phage tail sheath family protein [Corallococcus sp. 4LFB]|uniref:phage tail sheath family protein n=1 Tax=Corallococcus sp. 4LFB TaxID=3383249 RepID=UPI0039768798
MGNLSYKAPGVYVEQVASGTFPIVGVGTSTAGFVGLMPDKFSTKDSQGNTVTIKPAAEPGEAVLCTNFTEFKKRFLTLETPPPGASELDVAADFIGDMEGQELPSSWQSYPRYLAHAVYGFFNNGGTRCYVGRVALERVKPARPPKPPESAPTPPEEGETGGPELPSLKKVLEAFVTLDEIAIVAAPGIVDKARQEELIAHCAQSGLQDRVAVLDSPRDTAPQEMEKVVPARSEYAAYYYPWIRVFDPVAGGSLEVPPSGHVAGMYARVDTLRGVHKAPANEVLLGALDVSRRLSRSHQEGLNPVGINCIRDINGNIRVWGARTLGGDANGEFKYINVRRLFNFLRESIDQGTQWAVFEPNDSQLWARITRNVSAFLTTVWSEGGLFGATPQEAFFVKCDAETNPPANRDNGLVITEVGVALTRPAEFVVFRLSQLSGPK